MKCIKKNEKVMKVPEDIAESKVNKSGWQYCPKSEYKKSTDKEVIEKPRSVASDKPKKAKKKKPESEDAIEKMIKKKD